MRIAERAKENFSQRVEEEVNRIAAVLGPLDSLSVSSGDPPAKRVRCESGVETDRLSDSSDLKKKIQLLL